MTDDLLTGVEGAAGFAVYGAPAVDAAGAASTRHALVAGQIPGLLASKDPTLWGPAAEAGAKAHLGWLDTYRHSRQLLPQLAELRAELADLDRVLLVGSGGASLAAVAITRTLGVALTVLDGTDPHQARAAIYGETTGGAPRQALLRRTVVVVAGTSGVTVETDSACRALRQAFADLGFTDAEIGRHFVVVADPGSALVDIARELGAFVVQADPELVGRFGALSAYGLVAPALAGVDVAELLDEAELFAPSLAESTGNPALALGAALATAAVTGRDKVALVSDGSGLDGLGDWVEQLLAESTGKDGSGLLPVVVEGPSAPGAAGPDVLTVTYGGGLTPAAVPGAGIRPDVAVNGPLGAHLLAWEYATALATVVLGVDPFTTPDVAESEQNAAALLADGLPEETPTFVEGAVAVHTAGSARDLPGVLHELLRGLGGTGYLAVLAYLDRGGDADVAALRPLLAAASGGPVTFGWGQRALHSTGQYHKGGPQIGSFLQITGAVTKDLGVPGRPYTFGSVQAAQAAGDRQALTRRGRPVVRLHLTDRV
ncbi:MAG TPA: glucose-6-phosphate isomerase, partial [Actinoplanes sp.]|nr:glucose-6-phosphate isomerase [Actinoplanes sp.]